MVVRWWADRRGWLFQMTGHPYFADSSRVKTIVIFGLPNDDGGSSGDLDHVMVMVTCTQEGSAESSRLFR